MLAHVRAAIVSLVLLSVVTGIVYPAVVTAIAQAVFPHQANGSLIVKDGKAVGSALIGQPFDDPRYFWGRPSATSPFGYNAGASAGSNLSPTNADLIKTVQGRVDALRAADPGNPAAALYQVRRVARARKLDEAVVQRLVAQHTEGRQLGLFGEPRVNVLGLNL